MYLYLFIQEVNKDDLKWNLSAIYIQSMKLTKSLCKELLMIESVNFYT